MRINRFATMISALTADELASVRQGDLLILLEGLRPMERTPEVVAALSRVVDRLMGADRVRERGTVVMH